MSRLAMVMLLAVGALVAGCAGPGEPQEESSPLDGTLEFASQGFEGTFHLTLEPDGSAEGRFNRFDPFSFTVDDEQLATIAQALDDADLDDQPDDLDETDSTDDTLYRFDYDGVELEAYHGPAPEEVIEAGQLLEDVVTDNAPEY